MVYLNFCGYFQSLPAVPTDWEPETHPKYPKTQILEPMWVLPLKRGETTPLSSLIESFLPNYVLSTKLCLSQVMLLFSSTPYQFGNNHIAGWCHNIGVVLPSRVGCCWLGRSHPGNNSYIPYMQTKCSPGGHFNWLQGHIRQGSHGAEG